MSSPVVVSRIQNRRGSQLQFDGYVWNPLGPNSVYPNGYTGIGGYGSFPDFNSTNYPNVLLPGELAFCTDSRKVFLGNLSGEYVQIAEVSLAGEFLTPIEWILPPAGSWTLITRTIPGPITISLEYIATPFFTLLYSVTDNASTDWNSVGNNFSKNGELKITAINSATVLPPDPPLPAAPYTHVTLTDTGIEVNTTPTFDIHFKAQYSGSDIQILYKHDFAGSLRFSTNTIAWLPL